jgi:hypothetical protein
LTQAFCTRAAIISVICATARRCDSGTVCGIVASPPVFFAFTGAFERMPKTLIIFLAESSSVVFVSSFSI